MSKRKKQIIKQKLIGLLVMFSGVPLTRIMEGDITIPLFVVVFGFWLLINNKTFEEITAEMTKKELEEMKDDEEDL
jgi:hypothetical protein